MYKVQQYKEKTLFKNLIFSSNLHPKSTILCMKKYLYLLFVFVINVFLYLKQLYYSQIFYSSKYFIHFYNFPFSISFHFEIFTPLKHT